MLVDPGGWIAAIIQAMPQIAAKLPMILVCWFTKALPAARMRVYPSKTRTGTKAEKSK
jgi:hypothetical protein